MTETATPPPAGFTAGDREQHFYDLYGTGQELGPYAVLDLPAMANSGQVRAESLEPSVSGGGWVIAALRQVPDSHGRLLR